MEQSKAIELMDKHKMYKVIKPVIINTETILANLFAIARYPIEESNIDEYVEYLESVIPGMITDYREKGSLKKAVEKYPKLWSMSEDWRMYQGIGVKVITPMKEEYGGRINLEWFNRGVGNGSKGRGKVIRDYLERATFAWVNENLGRVELRDWEKRKRKK